MSKKEINLDEFFSDFQEGLGDLYDKSKEPSEDDIQIQELIDQLLKQRYEDAEEIAEGGMKKIFRSRDSLTSRQVAIAYLKHDEKEKLSAFIKEARLNARLQHPNIMTVYDIGVDDNHEVYFTMKLIEGEELGVILKSLEKNQSPQYDLQQLLYIFLKICEAISFAHSKKILHLDLKPANIQVGHFGEVLVCDWGLAKDLKLQNQTCELNLNDLPIFKQDTNLDLEVCSTLDGIVKGSPGYMAPEQAEGRNREKSERTDIYSLGAILYSLLTHKSPISTTDVRSSLKQCIDGDILTPTQRVDHKIPEALEAVTLKAMAVKPEDRYQSVALLIKDIEAYLSGFATSAEDADFLVQIKLLIQRNKMASSLISFAFIIICLLISAFVSQISVREKEALAAKETAEELQASAESAKAIAEIENKLRMELSRKAAPAFFRRAQLTWHNYQFPAFHHAIKMSLELDKQSKKSWNLYAFYLLGKMRFPEAKEAFEKGFGGNAYFKLIEKWNHRAINEDTVHQLILDFQDLNLNREIALVMAHFQLEKSADQKFQFLKKIIRQIDRNSNSITVLYDLSLKSIKIEGRGFRKSALLRGLDLERVDLSNTVITNINLFIGWKLTELKLKGTKISNIEPLKKNPLQNLDISYTSVNDINILQDMPLETVNLAGLRLKNLAPLLNCRQLKSVILSQDMIKDEANVLRALKERCTVIIVP
ncbi:serine/threonine-protein kinase [Lentisphaera profundi]|uniref:Serine/threonine-protein kinase n=1 Tax=Lentisphaera profundi TaxID=1658616 RepID=A0ABY7VUF4_9BACT|nr:serine/threonine-protein kinase [Lentisphaera profundi]WDE96461.1 serine/threonine-protein kinase [Lentisphaera profundi]